MGSIASLDKLKIIIFKIMIDEKKAYVQNIFTEVILVQFYYPAILLFGIS